MPGWSFNQTTTDSLHILYILSLNAIKSELLTASKSNQQRKSHKAVSFEVTNERWSGSVNEHNITFGMLVGICHSAWCHTPQDGKVNTNVDLWLQSPWPWSLSWWRWIPHHAEGHRLWFPDLHGHPLQPAGPYAPCCEDHIQSAVCYRCIRSCRAHPHTPPPTSWSWGFQYNPQPPKPSHR